MSGAIQAGDNVYKESSCAGLGDWLTCTIPQETLEWMGALSSLPHYRDCPIWMENENENAQDQLDPGCQVPLTRRGVHRRGYVETRKL
jgi:hypothetical protein